MASVWNDDVRFFRVRDERGNEVAAFYERVETLGRSVRGAFSRSSEALEELAEIEKTLKSAHVADVALLARTKELEAQKNVISATPIIVGGALIIPKG